MSVQETALQKAQENMIAEISPFEQVSRDLLAKAEAQEVSNEQQLASAVAVKKQITTHRKLVSDTRLGITRRFDEVKKAIMNRESEILLPLDQAQTALGEKILTYEEEQERIRKIEAERIAGLVKSVTLVDQYTLKTVADVEAKQKELQKVYDSLSDSDRTVGDVKATFTRSINTLADRKAYIEEQQRQEIERKRLAEEAAKQSEERQKIEAEKAANAEKERKIQAEKDRLEREKKRVADEKAADEEAKRKAAEDNARVKTGARTVTSFVIVNSEIVPREYCVPSDALIRSAIKQGIEVPGVEVKVERKI